MSIKLCADEEESMDGEVSRKSKLLLFQYGIGQILESEGIYRKE